MTEAIKSSRLKWNKTWSYVVCTVATIILITWIAGSFFKDGQQVSVRNSDNGAEASSPQNNQLQKIDLYYISEDGSALVKHEVEVSKTETLLAQARIVAEQQLQQPEAPLLTPFPDGTKLRAFYLAPNGDAFVELSQEVSLAHPGGSLDEIFTVYSLVNSLTGNFPDIHAVQILIEGKEVDTLAGHVDLRRPLGLNMKWVSGDDSLLLSTEGL